MPKDKKEKKNNNTTSNMSKRMYKILPLEKEEESNPKIKLYNEIIRHAMVYDTKPFSRCGITSDVELNRIFKYALGDYPEIFWVNYYSYTNDTIILRYRCLNEEGVLDVKQINSKRKALKRHAKFFTRGITKRTKPFDALMTIYRRLILTLDYDGRGLSNKVSADETKDDRLRSLYGAIVEHKVVCVGYAVAMQYLLQSVGISCGVVSSNYVNNKGHAFNALKLGDMCYYLDATWGDYSNTLDTSDREKNKHKISYDYCCVSLKELQMTAPEQAHDHTPNSEYYPNLEEFTATRHEYFRYKRAYVTRYNEDEIAEIFANAALEYNPKEMGAFSIGIRCYNNSLRDYIKSKIDNRVNFNRIVSKAKAIVSSKKRGHVKYLEMEFEWCEPTYTTTLYVWFK